MDVTFSENLSFPTRKPIHENETLSFLYQGIQIQVDLSCRKLVVPVIKITLHF